MYFVIVLTSMYTYMYVPGLTVTAIEGVECKEAYLTVD